MQNEKRIQQLVEVLKDRCMSSQEIMDKLNLSHRPSFRKNYLNPALESGVIKMKDENKNSPNQKYYVVERKNELSAVEELMEFIRLSPSSYNAIYQIKLILEKEGFIELDETKRFSLKANTNYYVTRNNSSIIAFKVGDIHDEFGYQIIASHSDSPCFKIKPNHNYKKKGYFNIATEGYGGMINYTWLDRPLSIAGSLTLRRGNEIRPYIIDIDRPLLSIPSMPIHFNREINKGYDFNHAIDMQPTISDVEVDLEDILKDEILVKHDEIIDYDLYVVCKQPGYIWGANKEYFSISRIDNLECAYTSLKAFISQNNPHNINVFACFDNEEVGSKTTQGADSTFLDDVLKRISLSLGKNEEEHKMAIAASYVVSADNAHAIHPNHPEVYDPLNHIFMNKGIAIKSNASQSYTSNGLSSAIFKMLCREANTPYQRFTNRADLKGGGTLGNISISHVSLISVDVGIPQLAMHSINETAGVKDVEYAIKVFEKFYASYIEIQNNRFTIK